jgi:hypothetical protein
LIVVKWRITMCSAGRFEPINPVGLQARDPGGYAEDTRERTGEPDLRYP